MGQDRRAVEADGAATTKPASLRRWSVCSALVRHLGITPSDKLNRRSPQWRPCLLGRTPLRRDGRRIRSLCHLFGASPLLGLAAIGRFRTAWVLEGAMATTWPSPALLIREVFKVGGWPKPQHCYSAAIAGVCSFS